MARVGKRDIECSRALGPCFHADRTAHRAVRQRLVARTGNDMDQRFPSVAVTHGHAERITLPSRTADGCLWADNPSARGGPFVGRLIERLLVASRWVLAPVFLGLCLALVALGIRFLQDVYHLLWHITALAESDMILKILVLIDLAQVASLVVLGLRGRRLPPGRRRRPAKLGWLGKLDAGRPCFWVCSNEWRLLHTAARRRTAATTRRGKDLQDREAPATSETTRNAPSITSNGV